MVKPGASVDYAQATLKMGGYWNWNPFPWQFGVP